MSNEPNDCRRAFSLDWALRARSTCQFCAWPKDARVHSSVFPRQRWPELWHWSAATAPTWTRLDNKKPGTRPGLFGIKSGFVSPHKARISVSG
jgi:hypothetical protein